MQQQALRYPWQNTDMRMQTAYNFYVNNPNGFFLIHKAPRAGCTTAMVASSLNFHERFTIIVPTNKIADKTVLKDAEKYSDRENTNIIKIHANHKCLINDALCREHPDLAELPILPLAKKCNECDNYDNCPITEIIRYGHVCDGVSLTYHKLVALMMAAGNMNATTANEVIETLQKTQNNIFDEVHEMQYGRHVSLTVADYSKTQPHLLMDKYIPLVNEYPNIRKVISQFSLLKDDPNIKQWIPAMYEDATSENYFRRKLSKTLQNYYCDLGHTEDNVKVMMGVYNEIIDVTVKRHDYNLTMYDIKLLYDIMAVVASEKIVIHGVNDNGTVKINMVAVDEFYNKLIGSYIKSIQAKAKRIILTSATICSHDYDSYFMNGAKPQKILFGENGDPMNTNSKMLILADTKKYHMLGRNSMNYNIEKITQNIIQILDSYGDENCMIITTNKKDSYRLYKMLNTLGRKHPVTYYKATDTMGVSSKARICIAIGAAHKPSNAYDAITETKDQSLILREEAMHCDTWQAWNRVKDPAGIEPSVVFAIGVTEEQCRNIATWGFDRNVTIENYDPDKRQKKNVNVKCTGKTIPLPKIKKCKGFEKMYTACVLDKPCKKVFTYESEKYLLFNIIRYFKTSQVKTFSECQLLRAFCYRDDVFAEQTFKGTYMKNAGTITDELLENHIEGRQTVGVYTLNHKNKVAWMCFDVDAHKDKNDTKEELKQKQLNAEEEKNKLCNFFDSNNLPYLLEASGTPYSYHIWLFLAPVEAAKARHFGEAVLKECDIKKMEVFPKQTRINKNGYGNLVKLPLSVNRKNGNRSKLFINGEWKERFDTIDVQAIDISSYEVPEVKKKDCYKPNKAQKAEGVRLFFTWALQQKLTGSQGHWLRIGIVREYYNNGTKDPYRLAELFKLQPDYDFDKSLEKVYSIIKDDYGCWKWETVKSMCPDFYNKFIKKQ